MILNNTLIALRLQMDHSNHNMVNMLSQQITIVLNPSVQMTNDSFQLLDEQMIRIGDDKAIPQV